MRTTRTVPHPRWPGQKVGPVAAREAREWNAYWAARDRSLVEGEARFQAKLKAGLFACGVAPEPGLAPVDRLGPVRVPA